MRPIESINDEQLLNLCLENQRYKEFTMDGLSGELIVLYCMNQYYDKHGNKDFTNQDIANIVSELVVEYEISQLVNEGYIEPSFEEDGIKYSPTEKCLKEFNAEDKA